MIRRRKERRRGVGEQYWKNKEMDATENIRSRTEWDIKGHSKEAARTICYETKKDEKVKGKIRSR